MIKKMKEEREILHNSFKTIAKDKIKDSVYEHQKAILLTREYTLLCIFPCVLIISGLYIFIRFFETVIHLFVIKRNSR